MTREKPITFRPTPEALEALAELVKVHGDRSKAINAALEIAPAHWAAAKPVDAVSSMPSNDPVRTGKINLKEAPKPRRSKTNATLAPRPLPPEPELRANTLRRTIQKPGWKHG